MMTWRNVGLETIIDILETDKYALSIWQEQTNGLEILPFNLSNLACRIYKHFKTSW